MVSPTCSECARSLSASEAYELNAKIYLDPCVQAAAQRAKEAGEPVAVTRYVDKAICPRCNAYIGEGGGVAAGPVRLCLPCSEVVQTWPYPQWLKLSLAGLLLLLVFALAHGRKYFEAGKNLYRGEQLVEKGQYRQALKYLKETLRIAPESDKGVLLTAKAALLSGDVETAQKALNGHNDGKFEDANKPEFIEVENLWNHALTALDKLKRAANLYNQGGHEAEAVKLVHEAASEYPQLQGIQTAVDQVDAAYAFQTKDYDRFMGIAKKEWEAQHSPAAA